MGVYAAVKGMLRRKLESMNKRPNEFGRLKFRILQHEPLFDDLRRSRLGLARDEFLAIGWRHGLVVIKALHKTTTEIFKEVDLAFRFNALNNHGQLNLLYQIDGRLHDFAAALARLDRP